MMNEHEKSNNVIWRLSQLEKCTDELDKKVETILTNHLPHIEVAINSIKTKLNVMTTINLAAIIAGIIIAKVLQ